MWLQSTGLLIGHVCTAHMNCDIADLQPLAVSVLVYVIISFAYNHN